jgi:diadenosine tetraphosphate (Ap4A) HIT family hydrolase
MARFEIHSQLLTDCHRMGRFAFCHVLLNKNAALPWFILVPQTAATDLLDLAEEQRTTAINEAAVIGMFVKRHLGYGKINFAAIGNIVPQLHLHVVGRKPNDPCWPAPVWGHLTESREYVASRVEEMRQLLVRDWSLKIEPW